MTLTSMAAAVGADSSNTKLILAGKAEMGELWGCHTPKFLYIDGLKEWCGNRSMVDLSEAEAEMAFFERN
ncbi:hypothetical protein DITRI_Ditri12bG0052000 [Diplodiscus trichospermus]